jgi:hypothetical protein
MSAGMVSMFIAFACEFFVLIYVARNEQRWLRKGRRWA